jgi:hypothetical protein
MRDAGGGLRQSLSSGRALRGPVGLTRLRTSPIAFRSGETSAAVGPPRQFVDDDIRVLSQPGSQCLAQQSHHTGHEIRLFLRRVRVRADDGINFGREGYVLAANAPATASHVVDEDRYASKGLAHPTGHQCRGAALQSLYLLL